MDTSILCPPNVHRLSANVICGVQQRVRPTRNFVVGHNGVDANVNPRPEQPRKATTPKPKLTTTVRNVPHRSLPDTRTKRRQEPEPVAHQHPEVAEKLDVMQLLILGEKLQRERRREYQRRYRKKQDDLVLSLERDTRQLRHEIVKLQHRRRNGPHSGPGQHHYKILRPLRSRPHFTAHRQEELCASDDDSRLVRDVDVEFGNLRMDAGGSVVAQTITRFTITKRTLYYVFPHLCSNSNGVSFDRLAVELLNQRVVVSGSARFDWDNTCGRVTGISTRSDLLTPMLRLLENEQDVARVFEKALITPEFQWRPTDTQALA